MMLSATKNLGLLLLAVQKSSLCCKEKEEGNSFRNGTVGKKEN